MRRHRWPWVSVWLLLGLPLAWGQETDVPEAWEERLDRIEQQLDRLLEAPARPKPRPKPPRRQRVTPPRAAAPAPDQRPEGLAPAPVAEPVAEPRPVTPTPRRGWTWEEIDAWRVFRTLGRGD
jgi:hypothetical protein